MIKSKNVLYHDKINTADLMFPEFETHRHRQGTYVKLDVFKEIKDSSTH